MQTLRLIDPNGYDVPEGRRTAATPTEAAHAETELLTVVAPQHAAQWADFGYDARNYRVA